MIQLINIFMEDTNSLLFGLFFSIFADSLQHDDKYSMPLDIMPRVSIEIENAHPVMSADRSILLASDAKLTDAMFINT